MRAVPYRRQQLERRLCSGPNSLGAGAAHCVAVTTPAVRCVFRNICYCRWHSPSRPQRFYLSVCPQLPYIGCVLFILLGTGCEVPSQCSGCDAGNARTRAQRRPASVGARAPRGTAAVPGGTLAPGPELSDKSFWRSVTDPGYFLYRVNAQRVRAAHPKRVAQNKPLCATRAHRARQRTKVRAPSLALSPTNIVTVPFRKCNPAAHTPLCRHPRYT